MISRRIVCFRPHVPFLLAALLMVSVGCSEQEVASTPAPPAAVIVAPVAEKDVTNYLEFTGRVEATDRVDLKARVTGFLDQRLFEEGGDVNKGDLLFVIEKAPYQAAVNQARADLQKAKASFAEAQATLNRVQTAVKSGAVSQQTLDEAVAQQKVQTAAVLEAQAVLERAELDLSYTEIRSPIKGRIGRETYTVGNVVTPASDPLATIVSEDPIYVVIPVSQRLILDYQQRVEETGSKTPTRIRLQFSDGSFFPETGEIDFADITINPNTDTLDLRSVFANPKGMLINGQFVNVIVEKAEVERGLVVPRSAVQIDQAGRYVLIVDRENKVELRRIETGQEREGQVVVTKGLKAGDQIITQGIQKVRPGQQVEPTEAESASPPTEG